MIEAIYSLIKGYWALWGGLLLLIVSALSLRRLAALARNLCQTLTQGFRV